MQSGEWMVSKYILKDKARYGVWKGKETNAAGYMDSFEEAKKLIEKMESWVDDYERTDKCSLNAARPAIK